MMVALLMLPANACDTLSRYLAGMDDPMYFTWQQSDEVVTHNTPPAATTTTLDTRQRIPTLLGEDALAPPARETPIAPLAQSGNLAQDLKDCQAPTLQATTPVSGFPGVPTIERSESSPVVAECMAGKGYRKVYRTLTGMFP